MMGAFGCSARSSRYMAAMPGTACRAASVRKNEFQAAMRGRGSMVEITVSSRSLTIPNVSSLGTISTGASNDRPSGSAMTAVRRPGGCPWARRRWSMYPPRSVEPVTVASPKLIVYRACTVAAVMKLRQPRRFRNSSAALPRWVSLQRGESTTRPSRRAPSSVP